ncbi:DUF2442 domain-containing protein [Nostoc sp. UHCC 0702]|nr:DUF2442 domain-containing protein [Nostoc sp. UHCC 0702]
MKEIYQVALRCQAKAINDRTLVIEFTNQEIKKYDIVHLLENPAFAPLLQRAFFKKFQVEQGGYGIVWNENIDLSEYELWKNGITVAEGDRSLTL